MQPSANSSKSHMGRNVAIVVVLLAFFFLVPVFPYTFASASFLGVSAQATGSVSLSYPVFHCGMVVNVQASASFQGFSASQSKTNPGWVCGRNG